ncbi:MAG TPA: N-acetyltransferase [Actinomycetes bacterium]|nr:N-acetyltransferase [Actinomycetes bacterium]
MSPLRLQGNDGAVTAFTVSERPDLTEKAWLCTNDLLPEYNNHGDVLDVYWPRLTGEVADFQFHLLGEDEQILARCRTIPLHWDGTVEDLPAGIDGALARGFDGGEPDALCALLVAVPRAVQQRGVSARALEAMSAVARRHGYSSLIAPVRPSAKEQYPLVPIERYAAWRRPDGSLFDPWMRTHERLGATVLKAEAQSLRITSTVADWEAWTGLAFPEDGDYWFPRGLTTVAVDRAADQGRYYEPNVWMHHRL